MQLNREHFRKAVPHADPDIIEPLIAAWNSGFHGAEHFGIVTAKQTAYFLGRAAVETWGFTRLDENLYYTKAVTIRRTWSTRFANDAAAQPFVKNPKALANKVYNGRLGNAATGDDGWNHRGSGVLQTTGLDNFKEVRDATGIDCVKNPELLRQFPTALEAAFVYWQNRNCNQYVERGDITGLVKRIQGGSAGLAETVHYTDAFLSVLIEPTSKPGRPVLRIGMRDAVNNGPIHDLQAKLSPEYYGGDIDGNFGPGTQNAVKEFQQARGLVPVDGIVGPMTWKELEK